MTLQFNKKKLKVNVNLNLLDHNIQIPSSQHFFTSISRKTKNQGISQSLETVEAIQNEHKGLTYNGTVYANAQTSSKIGFDFLIYMFLLIYIFCHISKMLRIT